jgi:hypothetical protein
LSFLPVFLRLICANLIVFLYACFMMIDVKLPKSHSDILTNFAYTTHVGKKGGLSTRKHKKKGKKSVDPYENGPNYFVQESDIGGKGGRASRSNIGEFETEEDWIKEIR